MRSATARARRSSVVSVRRWAALLGGRPSSMARRLERDESDRTAPKALIRPFGPPSPRGGRGRPSPSGRGKAAEGRRVRVRRRDPMSSRATMPPRAPPVSALEAPQGAGILRWASLNEEGMEWPADRTWRPCWRFRSILRSVRKRSISGRTTGFQTTTVCRSCAIAASASARAGKNWLPPSKPCFGATIGRPRGATASTAPITTIRPHMKRSPSPRAGRGSCSADPAGSKST